MKISLLTISILTLILGLAMAQSKCNGVKTKTISAETIANLPPGKTYDIDLTRKGTIYSFKDPDTDFSRVTVRSARGVRTFSELLQMSNADVRSRWVIGNSTDLGGQKAFASGGGGGLNYDCSSFMCTCRGLSDCFDMLMGKDCIGDSWCNPETGTCICIRPPTPPPSPARR